MAAQHALVLAWLRQNTQPYANSDLVVAHVDPVLTRYPTVRPKTDVYTYDDGRTQLLLCLHGLLPISFRGAPYHIPIALWLTRRYPREPPIAYVVPTPDMLVRPGNNIDVSGRSHLPYLRNWERKSEGCTLASLLESMQDAFALEPPVYAKPPPKLQQAPSPSPPPPPPPPPARTADEHARPPVPARPASVSATPALVLRPPPPLPPPVQHPPTYSPRPGQLSNIPATQIRSPPPLPPHPPSSLPFSPSSPPGIQRAYSLPVDPAGAPHLHQHAVPPPFVSPPPVAQAYSTQLHLVPPPPPPPPSLPPSPLPSHIPPPDLLDQDDLPLTSHASSPSPVPVTAPPRPPNPELLALHGRVHARFASELASLSQAMALDAERLRANQTDLLAGEPAVRDEMARLDAVRDVCRGVAARVRSVVHEAEHNVAELKRKGDPEVDELVCSTTIVHNQLVNLVAEDNAIEDTIYHLHRALNAGRIDLERFLRTTRVLAEEQFMKRALIEKIHAGVPPDARDLPWSSAPPPGWA